MNPQMIPELTIRDWFASQALNALIQRDTKIAQFELEKDTGEYRPVFYKDASAYVDLAAEAYMIAVAMLDARERLDLMPDDHPAQVDFPVRNKVIDP